MLYSNKVSVRMQTLKRFQRMPCSIHFIFNPSEILQVEGNATVQNKKMSMMYGMDILKGLSI